FKGYPDLKYSVGQDVARAGMPDPVPPTDTGHVDGYARIAKALQASKAAAEDETRAANPQADVERIVALVDAAPKLFVYGLGDDGRGAREFGLRLALLGRLVVHRPDPIATVASGAGARPGAALLVFSQSGKPPQRPILSHQCQDMGGKVVSGTRRTPH